MKCYNRIISAMSAIFMAAGLIILPVNAEMTIELTTYKAVPGYPVTALSGGQNVRGNIDWYVSNEEDGSYSQIVGASGNEWAITNACANKYIKACVDGVYSDALKIGEGLNTYSNKWWIPGDIPENTPEEYSFRPANPSDKNTKSKFFYQVLDTELVDGKKEYYVMQLGDYVTNGQFTRDTNNIFFDPSVEMSMAGWLNNVWYDLSSDDPQISKYARPNGGPLNSNGTTMDFNLEPYVVKDHLWLSERSEAIKNDFTVKAAISILSLNDMMKYYRRIGTNDIPGWMWLRTPTGNNKITLLQHNRNDDSYGPITRNASSTVDANYNIYPVFYLTEDVFKNLKIDIETAGSEILKEIIEVNNNSETALRKIGYTNGDLVKMGIIEPPLEPTASNISISVKKALPGYPILVNYTYSHNENKKEGNTKIYWYEADTENGIYTKVNGAEGNNWEIFNSCENKYIKAKVVPKTSDDIEGTADFFSANAIKVGKGLKTFNPDTDGGWSLPADMPETSPDEYKFAMESPSNSGFTYHMLDADIVNGKAEFFILQMGSMISNGRMTGIPDNYKFDPKVKYSVAGWLNDVWAVSATPGQSEYYNNGGNGPLNNNATAIDSNIKPYIENHVWRTERSGGSIVPNDFVFESKVALLSVTEFFEQYKKIGKNDYDKSWFRTPTENNGKANFFLLISSSGVWGKNGGSEGNIHIYRPVYYLSEDFFKNVRLDTSSLGDEVKKMIRSSISKEDMLKGQAKYTSEELANIFGYPEKTGYAENARILGNISVGESVTVDYSFNRNGINVNESRSKYQWYISDKKEGDFKIIEDADKKEYTISENDIGKYLAVKVTPIDEEGNICGSAMAKTSIAISDSCDMNIRFISLKDENGIISRVQGVSSATAEFNIANAGLDSNLTFIIAVYTSKNEMVGCKIKNINISSGTNDYSITLTGLDEQQSYKCRVMVFENMQNIRPLYTGEI